MSVEFPLPKYAQVVTELRRRIEDGTYRPGGMLPSESQLVREFGVGRTTIVRALQMLQHDGWITREHGLGSYVKGRPPAEKASTRPGRVVLERPETSGDVTILHAGTARLARHAGTLLGAGDQAGVLRQWLRLHRGEPSELVSCWFTTATATGTDLADPGLLSTGVRQHLQALKHVRFDHITELLTARLPAPEEAAALKISEAAPVLSITATVADASDRPLLVADVVLPGGLHELEDVYTVAD